jgi:hypothetical protein
MTLGSVSERGRQFLVGQKFHADRAHICTENAAGRRVAPMLSSERQNHSFRARRIDLGQVAIVLISGTASNDENGQNVHIGAFRAQSLDLTRIHRQKTILSGPELLVEIQAVALLVTPA